MSDPIDLLARAAGYLSRVETRGREDRDRLVFAQDQVMSVLRSLTPAEAMHMPLYQHACGQVQTYDGSEYDGDVRECDGCALPDPWRPLYVMAAPDA
jgi:hypothetical protein